MPKCCVVGAGRVGLVAAACFAEAGYATICIDSNQEKLLTLQDGLLPFYEPGLQELIRRNLNCGKLQVNSCLSEAVRTSDIIFLAVGTPVNQQGEADLSDLNHVVDELVQIGRELQDKRIIVNKSTVPVGTGDNLSRRLGKANGCYHYVSNPEFLREGSSIRDFTVPDRVVIGTDSNRTYEDLANLYKTFLPETTPFLKCSLEEAELIKQVANAFLGIRISFINEIANLCEQVGADVRKVVQGIGLDRRIGTSYLKPGPGFGGSCLPKDMRSILATSRLKRVDLSLIEAATRANELQRQLVVKKIKSVANDSQLQKTIGILGLAYKPETDDLREAPALDIIRLLIREGFKVKAYDPVCNPEAQKLFPGVSFASDPYDLAKDCDLLVLVTEWKEFGELDFLRIRKIMRSPQVLDCRNILDGDRLCQIGFTYFGAGISSTCVEHS